MTVTASSSHGTVVTTELATPVLVAPVPVGALPPSSLTALVASATVAAVGAALVVSARDVWFDNLQRPGWVPTTWVLPGRRHRRLPGPGGRRLAHLGAGAGIAGPHRWLVQLGLHLGVDRAVLRPLGAPLGPRRAAVLAAVALATLVAARRATRRGAWLLLPELVWIGYLGAVNAVIVAWN